MFKEPVVFIDIETTGASSHRSRIIEIAAIRVENNQTIEEFKTLINPGTRLPEFITNMTGISESDLVHAPYFEDIAYSLSQILDGAIFIAHHVRFDYSFIKRQLEACGYKYSPKLLCTVRLSRSLYPEARGHSLEKIIRRHNIQVSQRHRAEDDAKAILEFTKIAYSEHGQEQFALAVSKQLKRQTLPPNLSEEYLEPLQNTPGVYVFEDDNGSPIYIGKSVNIRNRVLSHFSQDTKLNSEMKLSQNTHKLRVIETDNELEALLLESEMIKELLPVYNKKLRRSNMQTVFMKEMNEEGYVTIQLENTDLSKAGSLNNIYGVHTSRMKAKASLERILKAFQLCPKLLGLEKTRNSCFHYQLHKCKGACIGKESQESYNERVELALERSKIEQWPYKSPIVLQMKDGEHKAIVIDQWIVIGYLNQIADSEPTFQEVKSSFDVDTYRILRGFIIKHQNKLTISSFNSVLTNY